MSCARSRRSSWPASRWSCSRRRRRRPRFGSSSAAPTWLDRDRDRPGTGQDELCKDDGSDSRRPEGCERMTPRLWAVCVLGVLAVALIAVAAVLVPWHRPPAPRADQLAALRELPADRVARARAFHSDLRPGAYAAMGVGLIAALVLGLTPLGAWLVTQAGRPFGGHWIAQAVLGGLIVVLAGEVITLPFAAR